MSSFPCSPTVRRTLDYDLVLPFRDGSRNCRHGRPIGSRLAVEDAFESLGHGFAARTRWMLDVSPCPSRELDRALLFRLARVLRCSTGRFGAGRRAHKHALSDELRRVFQRERGRIGPHPRARARTPIRPATPRILTSPPSAISGPSATCQHIRQPFRSQREPAVRWPLSGGNYRSLCRRTVNHGGSATEQFRLPPSPCLP